VEFEVPDDPSAVPDPADDGTPAEAGKKKRADGRAPIFDGCGGDACDSCDACEGCDFFLLRISTLLLVAAAIMPRTGGDRVAGAAIRGYQRRLSRFTPRCPQPVSCSAFALDAVATLGPRGGLAAAARRVRDCRRSG
jgi:hypothetical protein